MLSFRTLAVIVFLALAVLLVWSLATAPTSVATKEDVRKFVLDDLSADPTLSSGDHLFSVYSITYDSASKQWSASAKITLSPHSACPTVYIREYDLLPLRHGVDKVVTDNCRRATSIAFEEEAIIAGRSTPPVQAILFAGPYACGFALPLNASAVSPYCPRVNAISLAAFAGSLPSSAMWLTSWATGTQTVFVALDKDGNLVSFKTL